jgi:proline iminopeptidase
MALVDYELAQTLTLADGRTVEWESVGGPAHAPLIWVEGGPGFWAHLARPDVALISDLFHCHLVNAPGCGRTSRPAAAVDYALGPMIEFWEDVRRALGFERVTVMGHSWGGLVAPAWAAAHPESVDRLIVIDGYPGGAGFDPRLAAAERERALARHDGTDYIEAARKALDEEYDDESTADEETSHRNFSAAWPVYFADPASVLSAPHIARIREEVRLNLDMNNAWFAQPLEFDADVTILPSLGAVACPTLVIVGEHDFICGPELNRPIADAIPGARYVEIADAGHLPQYERPDAFRAAVIEWLDDTRTTD